jgi:NADH-quinone oxidoreductase subunit G
MAEEKKTEKSEETTPPTTTPGPELVEITIDGQKHQAPKGENLLQFMIEQGLPISYFCYHPGLSVVAVCRQCLVGLAKMNKLVPACQTMISDGMEVDNSSDKVLAARRQLLEFTLVNHPVDCPICDKAGECILQRHYMDWDHAPSKVDHPKVRKPKHVDLGPRIVLDDERCILCTRCVRFMAEVARDPQLVVSKRGSRAVLTVAPGRRLDHPYSLNTVDICPVGALTDKDFRFKIRVWELSSTKSVCNGCATGCPCEIHHRRNRIYRLVPRRYHNHDINEGWMCDFGRYTYKAVAADRLNLPRVKGKETGWEEAIGFVADKLKAAMEGDKAQIGVVLGADATNEDNFAASRLAFDFLGAPHVYLGAEPTGDQGDDFLRDDDPNPNRDGATACGRDKLKSSKELAADLTEGKLKALYVVGERLHLPAEALEKARALDLFAVQATHDRSSLCKNAQVALPAAAWAEVDGTITNREKKTQRLRAAVAPVDFARPHWQIVVQVARRAGLTLDFVSPKAIFEAMQQEIELFKDAEWGVELRPQLLRYAGSRG